MKLCKISKKKKTLFLTLLIFMSIIITIFLLYLNSNLLNVPSNQNNLKINQQEFFNQWFKETHQEQWIKNPSFENEIGWISEVNGDASDTQNFIRNGGADVEIIGEEYSTTLIWGTPNSTTSQGWYNATNPDIPVYPTQGHLINESGCFASHLWAEHAGTTTNAYQRTSVQWEKLITTPLNMSDYSITSASLEIQVNATAKAYVGCGSGDVWHWEGVEAPGDDGMVRFIEGDFIRFYARLANPDRNVNYEVAEYKTITLGQDGSRIANSYDFLNDTLFYANDINDLVFFLNQVLENGDYQNFLIILGIEFNCEDNCATDLDEFSEVYIKACNFTIDYVKKIDSLTTNSWTYLGNKIDNRGGEVDIINAKLYFSYKINNLWLNNLSPNSELRILINNQEFSQTIKLNLVPLTLTQANPLGFDITNLIPSYSNINFTIQIYIADDFDLTETYIITLDDVILNIRYELFFPAARDTTFLALLIIALLVSGLLTTYFIYYRQVLRFPKSVRKVRKYKKSLNKESKPTVEIVERKSSFKKAYNNITKGTSSSINVKSSTPSKNQKEGLIKKIKKVKLSKEMILFFFILMGLTFSPILISKNNNPLLFTHTNTNLNILEEISSGLYDRVTVSKQWINNSDFINSDNWISKVEGDKSDLELGISDESANYIVKGKSGAQLFSENGTSSGWIRIDDPEGLPLPDSYGMNEGGWYASHFWPDNAPQSLKVQWRKNFTMNVNMSDYSITSASLNMWINGTAQAISMDNGGIDRPGDTLVNNPSNTLQIATGDFARFFLILSDTNQTREFLTNQYQTSDLGKDSPIPITILNDTLITPINEETLIFYLEQALQYDHQNFSITLGIYIWCEDSGHPGDSDNWQLLLIKNFSLLINYEKKVNQFTSGGWEYYGNQIQENNYSIEVRSGKLFFDYKINQTKLISLSPNSKLVIYVNDIVYNHSIRFTEASITFMINSDDGFEMGNLIPTDQPIKLSIQTFIADEFVLDKEIMVSIDNVRLYITYDIIIPIEPSYLFQGLFALACVAAAALTTYIILYQRILKYPKAVRKVRKYSHTLHKSKPPEIKIIDRKKALNEAYQGELKTSDKFLK